MHTIMATAINARFVEDSAIKPILVLQRCVITDVIAHDSLSAAKKQIGRNGEATAGENLASYVTPGNLGGNLAASTGSQL